MVTIKQIPTDTSLTASTNVISMQYPNTILNTKMTLPQLVGPIDVVSPEHSSGDRSHEFQIASSKNASIEFSKAEYARPTKAELAHCTTSSRSSKYAQSQKLSSLTSQKYRIFPLEVNNGLIPAYIVKKHDGSIPYIHRGTSNATDFGTSFLIVGKILAPNPALYCHEKHRQCK